MQLLIARVSPRRSRPRRYVTTKPTGLPPTAVSSSRPRNQATGNLATEASLSQSGEFVELSPSLSALKSARKNSLITSPVLVLRDTKPGAGASSLDEGGGGWMLPRPHRSTMGFGEGRGLMEERNPFAAASMAGLGRTWSCNSPRGRDHVVTGRKSTGMDGQCHHAETARCSPASLEDYESFRLDDHSDEDTREEEGEGEKEEGEQEGEEEGKSGKHQKRQRKSTDTKHDRTNSTTTTINNSDQAFRCMDEATSSTWGMPTSTDGDSHKISLAGKANYGSFEDGNQAPGISAPFKQYRSGGGDDSRWGARGGWKHSGSTGTNGEGGTGLWTPIDTIRRSRATVLLYAATSARMVATWTLASYLSVSKAEPHLVKKSFSCSSLWRKSRRHFLCLSRRGAGVRSACRQ